MLVEITLCFLHFAVLVGGGEAFGMRAVQLYKQLVEEHGGKLFGHFIFSYVFLKNLARQLLRAVIFLKPYDVAKFFGVSISEEKEMVYIVANREKRDDIMRAIMEKAGSNTEAHGVIFSLPVDGVVGLKDFEGIL